MRSQLILPTILVCILHVACTKQKEELATSYFKPPKIVEAKSYKVPLEKAGSPTIVPALGMKKILAGKPETVHLKSNVFSAKPTRVVRAGTPRLILPNGEVYKLPEVVPAIDSPFIAGTPEIILMKDGFIKDDNVGSFSSIKAMHGLNSNEISSMCEDKAGNLWIDTQDVGVNKFDGIHIRHYTAKEGLASNRVWTIIQDQHGDMWKVFTNGQLC